jgi:glycosyltransferase involved in cell wall biosynthesis
MDASDILSVVITTYNRSDALLAVLDGLTRQTDQNFEVIVADDGSSLEHQQLIFESQSARTLRVIHVWHPDVGFTASSIRNRGVANSCGKYIIFLDGDCVPEVDFIARHKLLGQEGVFVNGSRVLLSADLTQGVLAGVESLCGRSPWFWLTQRFLGRANKLSGLIRLPDGSFRVRRTFSLKGIRSCNMGVWRSDFERVDGFDESFVGWGHEDADFVLRLHHSGVARKNGFCATEVFHLWHKEAARDRESQNARTVMERVTSKVIRSTTGFSHKHDSNGVVITRLG